MIDRTTPTPSTIRTLAADSGPACVSVYTLNGPDVRRIATMLKNQLTEAREALLTRSVPVSEADRVLEPAARLLADPAGLRVHAPATALFLGRDAPRMAPVPYELPELVTAGAHFHIKPLVPLLADETYYLLALDLAETRLYRADRWNITQLEIVDPDLPDDATERSLQYHSIGRAGNGAVMYHGQGGRSDAEDKHVEKFVRGIDRLVGEVVRRRPAPTVLAGVRYLTDAYRAVASGNGVVDDTVPGSTHGVPETELQRRSWELIEPQLREEAQEARDTLASLLGQKDPRAITDVESVLDAATDGRVDTLFLDPQPDIWGRWDPETRRATVHDTRLRGDEELANLAAVLVVGSGGTVLPATGTAPGDGPLAAIARYVE